MSEFNRQYLYHLKRHPLLTKAATSALFGALNEQIASLAAGDTQTLTVTLGHSSLSIPHTLSSKVLLMAIFGGAINAPFSHYSYALLNRGFRGRRMNFQLKVLQILVSMVTITPILSFLMVSFIGMINATQFTMLGRLAAEGNMRAFRLELFVIYRKIRLALRKSLLAVIQSSWITSPIFMAVAQNFLEPNLWVVFFTVCYFVLGTYNNATVKLAQKAAKEAEEADEAKTDEKSVKPDGKSVKPEKPSFKPAPVDEITDIKVNIVETPRTEAIKVEGDTVIHRIPVN